MLSEKDKKSLIRKIFEGGITIHNLPKNLYHKTAKKLMSAVDQAFTKEAENALYNELKTNIYIFSAAKTYTQVKDISSLIVDGNKLRPFNEFKKLALDKYEQYNVRWLKTEYDTAIGQSQTAVKWQEIQDTKKDFPFLQRKAVMDSHTSMECAMLNDIIAPVDSPFWATRSPLTHFDCRCILSKIDRFDDVVLSSQAKIDSVMKKTDNINPLFKGNPGIDKVIFNKSHPYFDIDKKDKALAKRNFNLPIN